MNSKKYQTKREFILDRVSMTFGSLANLYSSSPTPPSPEDLYQKAMELTNKIWKLESRSDPFPELEQKLKEYSGFQKKEKHVGRYNASELYSYFTDRIPPKRFLKPSQPGLEDIMRMYFGEVIHTGIAKLFGYEDKKYEIKIDEGITLVCKPDLELPDGEIIEIKTKEDLEAIEEVPPWYDYQCQSYMKAKELKSMRLYLVGWHFSRRRFDVKFNESVWRFIVARLKTYHQRVLDENK